MSRETKTYPGPGTFARGIHPTGHKNLAADSGIEVLPHPEKLAISLQQHIGAPSQAIVKPRQEVAAGECIAEAGGFVSAPVHAPLAGTTAMASVATLPNGRHVATIPITVAPDQPLTGRALWDDIYGGHWPMDVAEYTGEAICSAVAEAGVVGMGGAAFPTHVKFAANPDKPIDTVVINACECEPVLTADDRLMQEAPEAIVCGALLAGRACGAGKIYIAVEDNKPLAAQSLERAAKGTPVELAVVQTQYPMGGERQMIPAVLGREVPTGGLPLDVGVVVVNGATAAAMARAVVRHKPPTHRIVTVSGSGIVKAKNLLVPLGVSYGALIDYCGGMTDRAVRVVAGGPMMGFALAEANLSAPITKGTSGVTVLTAEDVRRAVETQCIRCGRCVDVCPLNLVPTKLAAAARARDWDLARRYSMAACCECGCCAYICPAGLPLTQLIRMGKAELPRE